MDVRFGIGVACGWLVVAGAASGAEQSGPAAAARPLVGAIRWDAWYGALPANADLPDPTRYLGYDAARARIPGRDPGQEAQRSLAAEPWRYRWPFFTERDAAGRAKAFNENRAEVLEKEIEYAVRGGLDYWAFDAYPEDCPLSYTLKTFLTCKNRDRLRFCLFLVMGSAYGRFADDAAFRAYAARMIAEPNYLKVEGDRPVLYMGFLNDAIVAKLLDGRWQRFCEGLAARGLGRPYLVIGSGNPTAAKRYAERLGGDALSHYTIQKDAKAGAYAELTEMTEAFWEKSAATGLPVAPICVTGWDRRTRVMNPVSWESFHTQPGADQLYFRGGSPEEIAAHVGRGVSWFQKHPGKNGTELVLIYAWNELDEGGWLVPALPPPDGEGTARLEALRKVLR